MTILVLSLYVLIILGCLYSLFSLVCVLSFFRNRGLKGNLVSPDRELPPISVLKPVKGLDPLCFENLSSFCVQDYPCYEVLLGFRDAGDPAVSLAEALAASAPCDVRVILKDEGSGTNQKVLNLQALGDAARYRMFALSDSDMVVDKDYLRRIMAEYQDGNNTGIVTSLYKISSPSSTGSALESLTIALDFIPSVLLARRLQGVTFGLGASILVSKEALGDIGGFSAIADYLADDYQIGFRLWSRGYRNVISHYVMENRVGQMTIASHMSHQLRWARTYRASRPSGYLGYGITHVFSFSLLLLCARPTAVSGLLAALVLALRYGIALVVYRKVIRTRRWLASLFLLPLKDILSFSIWMWSFAGSTVLWRGTRYRVAKDGRMEKA